MGRNWPHPIVPERANTSLTDTYMKYGNMITLKIEVDDSRAQFVDSFRIVYRQHNLESRKEKSVERNYRVENVLLVKS